MLWILKVTGYTGPCMRDEEWKRGVQWSLSFPGYWMKTLCWLNPVSSQTWRDIQRGPFPTTTVNTSRRGGRRTLSSGWRTQREMGESASTFVYAGSQKQTWWAALIVRLLPGVCLDGTLTAPTPAMSAPTCRTRRPRSLCPGWRPAQAGESDHVPDVPTDSVIVCFSLY